MVKIKREREEKERGILREEGVGKREAEKREKQERRRPREKGRKTYTDNEKSTSKYIY